MSTDQILEEHLQLRREDVLAAVADGAEMSRIRFVDPSGQSVDSVAQVKPGGTSGAPAALRGSIPAI